MDTFKARNNRISNQNLSETAQNPARVFEKNTLADLVKAVPRFMRKKGRKLRKHFGYSLYDYPNDVMSCRSAWENESAMSFVGSAVIDRSHS